MPSLNQNQSNNYGYNTGQQYGQNQSASTGSNSSQGTSSSTSRSQSTTGPDPGLLARWDTGYADAINSHTNLYNDMLSGYRSVLGQTQGQADRIQGGYGELSQSVLAQLAGSDAARRGEINDAYNQQAGGLTQSMTSRGLGNTTIQDSMQRGNELDRQKALNNLAGQTAQQNAGVMGQYGAAGLGAQSQQLGLYGTLGSSMMGNTAAYLLNPLAWPPNRTDSFSESNSQSQQTSQGQNQSDSAGYNYGANIGYNQGNSYGYGMTGSSPQYYGGGGGGTGGGTSSGGGGDFGYGGGGINGYGNVDYGSNGTAIDPSTGLPYDQNTQSPGGGFVNTDQSGNIIGGTASASGTGYNPYFPAGGTVGAPGTGDYPNLRLY